jgi:hypothetical protein
MADMRRGEIMLDPQDLDHSMIQLAEVFNLLPEDLDELRPVAALFHRPFPITVDDANAILYEQMPLGDKFTFDTETDGLVLFSRDKETLVEALIEMAMYMAGFSTMMGSEETWVIEFTIGAWKPVKKRMMRQLGLPVHDHPRAVVGLPPKTSEDPTHDAYPFRTLVSHFDLASFHQMVMLAGREDIAVYFPPETHPKVLAVYVYMRRAMQEVAQGIDLVDYETFNARLLQEIQRMEKLFEPSSLSLPAWLHDRHSDSLPEYPKLFRPASDHQPEPTEKENPFEAFIDQLFADDEPDDDSPA